MRYEFKLPDLAEGMVEGELVAWLVAVGDDIKAEQPVAEVMTDKATVAIPSPVAGKLLELPWKEGDVVKIGATLFVLDAASDAPSQRKSGGHVSPDAEPAPPASAAPAGPAAPTTASAATEGAAPAPDAAASVRPASAPAAHAARASTSTSAPTTPPVTPRGARALAAPATRRLARELGIDIGQLIGTGPGGRVTAEDVAMHAQAGLPPAPAAPAPAPAATSADDAPAPARRQVPTYVPAERPGAAAEGEERQKIRGLRKAIYETMTRSKGTAAHFTYVDEVDCEALYAARERLAQAAEAKGVKLTYLTFIAKAAMLALGRFPKMNARVDDDAMELVLKKHVHLGIAAATDPGLVVPVVRHADRMTLLELAYHIQDLGARARQNTLRPDELKGSTFTITSLGKLGGLLATPIINHPEVGIMGIHQMQKRAVVLGEDDDRIVVRRRMNLSLSFDHRVIDGHEGAAFAQAVKAYLEDPGLMLLEMA